MLSAELTAVLYNKEDVELFLCDRPAASKAYPLTPDARVELIGKTALPLLDPLEHYTDYSHRRVIAMVRSIEKRLHPRIDNEYALSFAGKETFKSVFHVYVASALYLSRLLHKTGPWLVRNEQTWEHTDKLETAIRILLKNLVQQGIGIFRMGLIGPHNNEVLVRIINSIILKIHATRNCIWTTGAAYGLDEVIKHLHELDPDLTVFCFGPDDRKSIFRSIKSLILALNPFSHPYIIALTPLHSKKLDYYKTIGEILNTVEDPYFEAISDTLINFITGVVGYTESLAHYTHELFSRTNPKCLLAHHLRWREAAVLGETAKQLGIPSILISHGSHTVPTNVTSAYEQHEHAKGMVVSSLATETIVQSPMGEEAADMFMPDLKHISFKPILWGNKKLTGIAKKRVFTILHAGTYKVLGGRPWIYETSNEFVYGLQQLVSAVHALDNTKLIIRMRYGQECSVTSLKKLLPVTGNAIIKTGGSVSDDLEQSDLLISFSSTTIEEALYARKPVGIFGASCRYRHVHGSSLPPDGSNRSAVYHLNSDNLSGMLHGIIKAHKGKPLTDNELIGYTWSLNVPDRKEFITDILKRKNRSVVEKRKA